MDTAKVFSRHSLRQRLATFTLGACLALAAPLAGAAPSFTTDGGRTAVQLDRGFLSALQSLSVKPGAISPGRLVTSKGKTWAVFGITTGVVDLKPLKAEIAHEGGLTLRAGSTQVELSSFLIDLTGNRPVLTGLVVANDTLVGRLPLFDLDIGTAKIQNLHDYLRVNGVNVTLSSEAAAALNGVFGITALSKGLPVGTAHVRTSLD